MSDKIIIDTSERSLEEQINAVVDSYYAPEPYTTRPRPLYAVLHDFAAGKFARAPEPEIRKPKWAETAVLIEDPLGNSYVTARASPGKDGAGAYGPTKPTRREAIEAFNELFAPGGES